jgi:hypothetical protein
MGAQSANVAEEATRQQSNGIVMYVVKKPTNFMRQTTGRNAGTAL